jgi:hypothetical protein
MPQANKSYHFPCIQVPRAKRRGLVELGLVLVDGLKKICAAGRYARIVSYLTNELMVEIYSKLRSILAAGMFGRGIKATDITRMQNTFSSQLNIISPFQFPHTYVQASRLTVLRPLFLRSGVLFLTRHPKKQ